MRNGKAESLRKKQGQGIDCLQIFGFFLFRLGGLLLLKNGINVKGLKKNPKAKQQEV